MNRRAFIALGTAMVFPQLGKAFAKNSAAKGLPDAELLDLVQRHTLKYFWDYGHPVSGMARERTSTLWKDQPEIVTTGGTGFGIMAMIAGTERGWITRQQLADRLTQIIGFLEQSDKFYGVFPHWLNGSTGKTVPFGHADDGSDLVETSYLMMGLLSARQYLSSPSPEETSLRDRINTLWKSVEWNWHNPPGTNTLYWHWSPGHDWKMNLPVKGWNECLITHLLASCSPTHSVGLGVYKECWASHGHIRNGKQFYGMTLPLGPDGGGPLFFSHYSFMGLDPRGLKDAYADYWQQNLAHTLINRAHCIVNPHKYKGYGPDCWGLTASDGDNAYNAHHPGMDTGVVAPTAALSSFPYTPQYSMQALRHFYEDRGRQIWSECGFFDAFNPATGWCAPGHIAIDQGPIIVMIENHRSGLLWNLFMSCLEVKLGLQKLGFKSPHLQGPQQATAPALI